MVFTCATYEESSGWRRLLIVGADHRVNGGMPELCRRNCDNAPRKAPPARRLSLTSLAAAIAARQIGARRPWSLAFRSRTRTPRRRVAISQRSAGTAQYARNISRLLHQARTLQNIAVCFDGSLGFRGSHQDRNTAEHLPEHFTRRCSTSAGTATDTCGMF